MTKLLLILACLLLRAAVSSAGTGTDRYDRARNYCDWREYKAALVLLDSIGTDSLAQALTCRVHLLRKDYRPALTAAIQTAGLWPETGAGRAALWQAAYARERLEQYDAAVETYRCAMAADTALTEYARFRIDRCLFKKRTKPGRKGYPGDAFQPVIPQRPPAGPGGTSGERWATEGAGKRPAALKLAARHVRRKRYDAARKLLAGFIKAYPRSSYRCEAAYQIAKGWERQGRLAEAVAAYRSAAEIDTASRWADDAAFREGWCRLKQQDTAGALASWNWLITSGRRSDQLGASLYWTAKVLEARGDSIAARECQKQLRLSDPYGFYGLKVCRMPEADSLPADSLEAGADSTASDRPGPEPCAIQADSAFLLAQRLAEYGLTDDAAAALSRIEVWYRQDARSLYHLAKAYAACGRDDRAIDVAGRALKLHDGVRPAELLALVYPRKYLGAVARHGGEYGLDPAMVLAVIHKESRFEEKSRSRAGARGLMQIMPKTGRLLSGDRKFRKDSLYDPFLSIRFGTRFLAGMIKEFNGSWAQALAAYNAGPGRVHQWLKGKQVRQDDDYFLEEIFIPETKRYIMVVMENYYIYRQLLEEEGA